MYDLLTEYLKQRKINRWLVMSIRCTLFQQQPLLQRGCFLALYIPDETVHTAPKRPETIEVLSTLDYS